jgi:hypothetical protein
MTGKAQVAALPATKLLPCSVGSRMPAPCLKLGTLTTDSHDSRLGWMTPVRYAATRRSAPPRSSDGSAFDRRA